LRFGLPLRHAVGERAGGEVALMLLPFFYFPSPAGASQFLSG
jgi:hypothetical protein